jgi:hypothetical protein
MARASQPHFQTLPVGRLLYRPLDESAYVAVSRAGDEAYWVVADAWTSDQRAAGPFRSGDALRALRLANTMVPEGCELMPWQPGIELFRPRPLPGHANDWSRVEPSWLGASVSRYTEDAISTVINESCCAPARDQPRIDWTIDATSKTEAQRLALAQFPDMDVSQVGVLKRLWNVHPAGSPVVAGTRELLGEFVIIDQPPLPEA